MRALVNHMGVSLYRADTFLEDFSPTARGSFARKFKDGTAVAIPSKEIHPYYGRIR